MNKLNHIPFLEKIDDFFAFYGLGKPLHPEVMCMRLENQPDEKLMHVPLYRANFFRIIHFENADLQFWAGKKEQLTSKNCLVFSYPGKLESWTRAERLYGTVIYFTGNFAGLDVTHQNFDAEYPFFNFNSEAFLTLTPEDAAELSYCEQELVKEMYSNAPDKLPFLKKLLQLYLHKITRIYYQKNSTLSSDDQNSKAIFNRFRQILDEKIQELANSDNKQTPSVSDIAEQLHTHPSYLNDIIKKLTGKTASSFIQDKLILEAKSYLLHTPLQVSEIAYRLGFDTPQYFNRFFKKHCAVTPSEFRNQ